jgi:hypothetical protein
MRGSPYRLDELGWAQFERLCDELLRERADLAPAAWQGRADRIRVARLERDVELVPGRLSPGMGWVAVWWSPASSRAELDPSRLLVEVQRRITEEVGTALPPGVVLLTNAVLPGENDDRSTPGLEVVGPAEIGAVVDATPALRRRLPTLLGVCDLDGLLDADVIARSSGDVAAAADLARVFVPTRAHAQALAVLERHGFAVLTGPPEMGKTAIARMLGLSLLAEGWELHECTRPDELWARFDRQRPQVFVADDAFGSTEYRPDAAERWALELDLVLREMDEQHWLVWTSRPTPLRSALVRIHREHGVERWPQPAEVQVDASELDVEEKALILFRHAGAARLGDASIRLVQQYGWELVSHRHFTPERIRRFVWNRLDALAAEAATLGPRRLAAAVAAEVAEPTEAMAASLRALPPEHRALLVALLDVPAGPVGESELAAAARRHRDEGLPKAPGALVDRLLDHFLRLVPPQSVTWVHPSWRDLVIDELVSDPDARVRFLERCGLDGILLALSTGGGAVGPRARPLLVADRDWDTLDGRVYTLAVELDSAAVRRLLYAVEAALAATPDERRRGELKATAASLLERLRRVWERGAAAIDGNVLEPYIAVRAQLEPAVPLPDVGRAWVALLPSVPVRVDDHVEVRRLDEWLRLAAAVGEAEPAALEGLGFRRQAVELLERLVEDVRALSVEAERPPTAALLASCLRRLAEAAHPNVPAATAAAIAALEVDEHDDAPAGPLEAPVGDAPSSAVVRRILRDLGR